MSIFIVYVTQYYIYFGFSCLMDCYTPTTSLILSSSTYCYRKIVTDVLASTTCVHCLLLKI
jgi:hypothetical protein